MLMGYARISTGEQTLDLQRDALAQAGCEKTYTETASGAKADRPVLRDVLGTCAPATPSSSGASIASAARCGT